MSGNALFEYLLRLGDSNLVMAQRLSVWCGKAPVLEEDLALANVALDLLGQARLWLGYAGEIENKGRDEDALAYLRDGESFRNLLLCEQPNGNYADTTARQFFFDAWHNLLLHRLAGSQDERVAAIAAKALKESAYHLQRSSEWTIRLGDGTDESRIKMQAAVDRLWPYTGEMFETDGIDLALLAAGIACDGGALREPWLALVGNVLSEATLATPGQVWMQSGGRVGRHTEHLGYLLAEMQFLQRTYPDSRW